MPDFQIRSSLAGFAQQRNQDYTFLNYIFNILVAKFQALHLLLPTDMKPGSSILLQEETGTLTFTDKQFSLIVWNDDVNTFEHVIESLIDICGHSTEQAEQCAIIIDSKGKYAVKEGDYDMLKPMCDAITDRGIGATIEVLA